jgi:hypothetical protein
LISQLLGGNYIEFYPKDDIFLVPLNNCGRNLELLSIAASFNTERFSSRNLWVKVVLLYGDTCG